MNSKILIAGFACLSMLAAAQSNDKQQKPSNTGQVTAPRDAATGQATGRKMNQKAENDGIVHRDLAAREASAPSASELRESPTKASTGKTSLRESSSPSVSEIRESPSKGSALRESPTRASTGKTGIQDDAQSSRTADVNRDGKADLVWSPRSNKAVTAGDVDGDGAPDAAASKNSGHATEQKPAAVKSPRDAATGQASGKRQH